MRTVVLQMLLLVVMLAALSATLLLPLLYDPELGVIYPRDLIVMVGLVLFLGRARWGGVLRWLVTLGWGGVVFFELVRAIGISAMSQQPLLYDAFFLVKHLYVLLSDLMGWKALAMFAGVLGAWLMITATGHWILGRVASVSAAWGTVGSCRAKWPLASTSSRVRVALSSTTVTLGGLKSSAQAQAAAITLGWPACAADTSTVGPWLSSR